MSVSAEYLAAMVNTATVARHHGVEAFVNMSQMTVTQMSITESTDSPQHKLHWLAEQALSWSSLPVVTIRPTVFLEGFFRLFAAPGVRDDDEPALPMGGGKTSPISAVDLARAVSVVLEDFFPRSTESDRRCAAISLPAKEGDLRCAKATPRRDGVIC
jgi:uncharacterized protein YbjT (DUF2867 family)